MHITISIPSQFRLEPSEGRQQMASVGNRPAFQPGMVKVFSKDFVQELWEIREVHFFILQMAKKTAANFSCWQRARGSKPANRRCFALITLLSFQISGWRGPKSSNRTHTRPPKNTCLPPRSLLLLAAKCGSYVCYCCAPWLRRRPPPGCP